MGLSINSPVRLGVFPPTATPTGFYRQRFGGVSFPHWNPGLLGLSRSPVVPPSLSKHERGATQSASHRLAHPVHDLDMHPFRPGCPSLPLLSVWINVSSLIDAKSWMDWMLGFFFSLSTIDFFSIHFQMYPGYIEIEGKIIYNGKMCGWNLEIQHFFLMRSDLFIIYIHLFPSVLPFTVGSLYILLYFTFFQILFIYF